ncbi:MAG: aldehyde ferredoxin oxidoreductase family protein [Candidatus Hodarchaeota archaeon]
MPVGFFGKILSIDLSKKQFNVINLSDKFYRHFLGGYGLGCRIIYDYTRPQIEPLAPESILGFFPGLLTSTTAPLSGRYMVVGKSPLTRTWGDANSGGTFGPEIKRCGYDAILINGKAKNPVYIAILDETNEILEATDIWGIDFIRSEELLKIRHGKTAKVAGIGQAGENLSKISGIANDKGRIAARSGLGAIMGSKNLKALILRGNHRLDFYDKNQFMNLVKKYNSIKEKKKPGSFIKFILNKAPNLAKLMRRLKVKFSGPAGMVKYIYQNFGTSVGNTLSAETGDSPVKNWKGVGMYDFPFSKSKDLSANIIQNYKIKDYGCFSCPIQCGAILKVPELELEETFLPEYETCCAFGALLLNNDLISIFELNELCNRAAIDTISTGATVAFAIECFESNILNLEDTEGLVLKWGDSKTIVQLVKKIIDREGIGDILADGCEIAANKIGKNSMKYAMVSQGSEVAMHNPRIFPSLAFTYAYDPTPSRHTAASVDFVDIGPIDKFQTGFKLPRGWKKNEMKRQKAQKMVTCFHQTINSSGLCLFSTLFGPYPFIDLINSLTGWDMDVEEILEIGMRIQTLRQAFTLREGIKIIDNELPGRITGHPPDEKGPTKNVSVEYKEFYKGYAKEMGWDPETGVPLKETLKRLNLDFVIKDLY